MGFDRKECGTDDARSGAKGTSLHGHGLRKPVIATSGGAFCEADHKLIDAGAMFTRR